MIRGLVRVPWMCLVNIALGREVKREIEAAHDVVHPDEPELRDVYGVVLGPDGERAPFARFTDGDLPRGVAFAPVTPETQRGGIAGDMFVVIINRNAWPVNEVLRISGPFEEFVRGRLPARGDR